MKNGRTWILVPVLLVASVSMSCKDPVKPEPATKADVASSEQRFQVKGVVQEVSPGRRKVKIAHEKIPGYMEAMTMTFEVKDERELAGLQAGDSIAFRMIVTKEDGWIDQIQKLAAVTNAAPAAVPTPDTFRRVRDVDPLKVGDLVPEYRFTNELGQAVRLGDFKGKAVALTFIFTRCPFPTFCPRMSSNFEQAKKQIKALPNSPANWHLLSLTIDPQFDTPTVLKGYARNHGYDSGHWSFLTGDLIEITAIAEQFELMFWRPDPKEVTGISHNLRTVVLDTEGRVRKVFTENEWKVEDLVSELVKAAQVPPKPADRSSK